MSFTTGFTAPAFTFPPQYWFPPFFTRQPNETTRSSQLASWAELILSYCAHHHIFQLTPADAAATPLFNNAKLRRRLPLRDIVEVLNWMASEPGGRRVQWVDEKAGPASERCWVFWRRPEEWATLVEGWIDETGQRNSVLTLYELAEGDATVGQDFHGIHQGLLQKSLQVLVKRGKAQIFGQENELGIKFF